MSKHANELLVSQLNGFNSICWYPSAGMDFRPMMYLTKAWAERNGWEEEKFPDCFVMTNACGDEINDVFLKDPEPVLYADLRTRITASHVVELPTLSLPKNPELAYDALKMLNPKAKHDLYKHYGRLLSMSVHIQSKQLGDWDTHLYYVISENTAFALRLLLKNEVTVDYIYRAHYGYKWCPDSAGSRSTGKFLLKLLHPLKTRYFISDRDMAYIHTVDPAELLYPRQLGWKKQADLEEVAAIQSDHRRRNRYYEFGFSICRVLPGEHYERGGDDFCPPEDQTFQYMRYASVWGPRASEPLPMGQCLREMLVYSVHFLEIKTYEDLMRKILPLDAMPFPVWVREREMYFLDQDRWQLEEAYDCGNPVELEDGTALFIRKDWKIEDFLRLLGKLQEAGLVAIPDWAGRRPLP